MYSEKLEKLISLALADGVLTEKEKQILLKIAETEGVDLDEFEMVLDDRVQQSALLKKDSEESALAQLLQLLDEAEQKEKQKLERAIEKLLKKYNKTSNIKEIAKTTGEIASQILSAATGGVSGVLSGAAKTIFGNNNEDDEDEIQEKIEALTKEAEKRIRTKKESIISTFPIPNSKDDILELLDYIYPKTKGKNVHKDVWTDKFRTIIVRSKRSFSGDRTFLAEIFYYEQQHRNQQIIKILIYTVIVITILIGMVISYRLS
jgi:hypothetical protein